MTPLMDLETDLYIDLERTDNYTINPLQGFINDSETAPRRDPLYIVIPVTVIYCVIFLTGIIGNCITCIVIVKNKYMHTATNYYLFSLAISDLLLLISGLPQEMYYLWRRYPYIFGEAFCVIRGLASETSANATVLTITAFTVERYVAICHPLRSHTMSKLSRAIKFICVIWTLAIVLAIPQSLQFGLAVIRLPAMTEPTTVCTVKRVILEHAFEISSFVFFVAPMTVITVLYVVIGLKLRHPNMLRKESPTSTNKRESAVHIVRHVPSKYSHGQSSRRVVKMLVAVVVAFFVCWAPFHAQRLLAIYGDTGRRPSPQMLKIYSTLTYISGVFYYLSTTINPILYHILSHKFREAFKSRLRSCCSPRREPTNTRQSAFQRVVTIPQSHSPTTIDEVLDSADCQISAPRKLMSNIHNNSAKNIVISNHNISKNLTSKNNPSLCKINDRINSANRYTRVLCKVQKLTNTNGGCKNNIEVIYLKKKNSKLADVNHGHRKSNCSISNSSLQDADSEDLREELQNLDVYMDKHEEERL